MKACRTCVILNPNAGTAEDLEVLRAELGRIESCFVIESERKGHPTLLARQAVAQGYARVVAAGGDGTVNEVLHGLAPRFPVEFGVIPMGTGNDFARSLAIPPDTPGAVEALHRDVSHPVDVLKVSGTRTYYAANASGAGFVPLLDEEVTPQTKDWWGSLAYFWGAIKAIPKVPQFHARISFDGGPEEPFDLYNVMVCNGRYVGGGIPIAPTALVDDGLADVLIVPTITWGELPRLVARLLEGEHLSLDDIVVRRARQVDIRSDPPLPFNVDGEPTGHSPVRYEVLPGVLRVILGAPPPKEPPTSAHSRRQAAP